jgi:hypothetical protein
MTVRRALAGLLGLSVLAAWGCATGGGSANRAAGGSASPSGSYAQQLLRRRCQGCHRMPQPESLSRKEWQEALARMEQRIHLPAADWDSLAALGAPDSSVAAPARQ